MPCGWEGNRRSGVALATRHTADTSGSPPTGSRPTRERDGTPAYTRALSGAWR